VFLVLSLRLFRSAFQVSGPEGWLAGFFLCATLSMPLRVVLTQNNAVLGEREHLLILVSHGLMSAALCCYTLFVDRVFRPESGWAVMVTTCMIGVQILAPLALVFFGGHRDELHPSVLAVGVIRALPFAWGFCEAYRYYGKMKKRAALGLSDAVVANRFALFSVWNGSLFILPIAVVVLRLWAAVGTESGRMMGESGTAQLILGISRVALLGLAGSTGVSLWLSFFPPKAWVARLQTRADASSP
jgi:hypothetical protein